MAKSALQQALEVVAVRKGIVSRVDGMGGDRADGFVNLTTGLGQASRDKSLQAFFEQSPNLTDEELEDLWGDSDLVRTIIEAPIDDAFRKPIEITVSADAEVEDDEDFEDPSDSSQTRGDSVDTGPGLDDEVTAGLMKQLRALGAFEKMKEAAIWGRHFGGGVVFVGALDGKDVAEPLDEDAIDAVGFLNVFDKRGLRPATFFTDPLKPNFGDVMHYEIQPTFVGNGVTPTEQTNKRIHSSRLIVFPGVLTTARRKNTNYLWDLSVMQSIMPVFRQFSTGFDSVGHLMQDAAQGVFKLKDFIAMLTSNNGAELSTRLALMDMTRSSSRALVLDADTEEFHREAYSFAGVKDVLEMFMLRLSAAARMPVTRLFSQAPSGLSATGESDMQTWYERVEAWQTHTLKPRLERLVCLLLKAKNGPSEGVEPATWTVKFTPLKQMTEIETATLRKTVAEADAIYVAAQVVTAEEVAINRFRPEGWSADTVVDLELRKEISDIDAEAAIEKARNPPPPPPASAPPVPGAPAMSPPKPAAPKE